jgi:hypothetical protein
MLFAPALVLSAGLAAAASIPKRQIPLAKVLIGAPGSVIAADFDGVNFNIVANVSEEGTNPSWMAFREPNLLYAVDEFNENTRLFTVSSQLWNSGIVEQARWNNTRATFESPKSNFGA